MDAQETAARRAARKNRGATVKRSVRFTTATDDTADGADTVAAPALMVWVKGDSASRKDFGRWLERWDGDVVAVCEAEGEHTRTVERRPLTRKDGSPVIAGDGSPVMRNVVTSETTEPSCYMLLFASSDANRTVAAWDEVYGQIRGYRCAERWCVQEDGRQPYELVNGYRVPQSAGAGEKTEAAARRMRTARTFHLKEGETAPDGCGSKRAKAQAPVNGATTDALGKRDNERMNEIAVLLGTA